MAEISEKNIKNLINDTVSLLQDIKSELDGDMRSYEEFKEQILVNFGELSNILEIL